MKRTRLYRPCGRSWNIALAPVLDSASRLTSGSGGGRSFNAPIPESEVRFSARRGALLATAREDGISFAFFTDDGVEVDSYASFKSCRH